MLYRRHETNSPQPGNYDRSGPRMTYPKRHGLLASLEASRAEYAAGCYHVVNPGMLGEEFEAILEGEPSDEELDALLGLVRPEPR